SSLTSKEPEMRTSSWRDAKWCSEVDPGRRPGKVLVLPGADSSSLARLALVLSIAFVSGCESSKSPPPTVTIFIAASTRDAIEEIAGIFEKGTGIEVKVSPGASNALATQIAEGAPAQL